MITHTDLKTIGIYIQLALLMYVTGPDEPVSSILQYYEE